MKTQTIELRPKDYIMFNGGLYVGNKSEDNVIKVKLPTEYEIWKMKTKISTNKTQ